MKKHFIKLMRVLILLSLAGCDSETDPSGNKWVLTPSGVCSTDSRIPIDSLEIWADAWARKTKDLHVTDSMLISAKSLQSILGGNEVQSFDSSYPTLRMYFGKPAESNAVYILMVAVDSACNDKTGELPYTMFGAQDSVGIAISNSEAQAYVKNFQTYFYEDLKRFSTYPHVRAYNFEASYVAKLLESAFCSYLIAYIAIRESACINFYDHCPENEEDVEAIDLLLRQTKGNNHVTNLALNFAMPCPKYCGEPLIWIRK